MALRRSPGGSIYPSYYKGGELHALKYGGFGRDSPAPCDLMRREEEFVTAHPCHVPVWVDFY